MKQKKRSLFFFLVCVSTIASAQNEDTNKGIKWTTGFSWEQVKQKAKTENKYIFLDCYTTWCGPCKIMDKSIYLNDTVSRFYNEKFISVKVQMDKTEKDNDGVKAWYEDANLIAKEYHVEGYPTFVFLSPEGRIVHKDLGLKEAHKFIAMGKDAIAPGKVYNDEYAQYDAFVKAWKGGRKDYGLYPKMIKVASKLNDTALFYGLQKELITYISQLSREKRYTKEMIEMWTSFIIPSTSRVFNFFRKDGDMIDKVICIKGFAADIVDRTIQREICIPFMEEQSKGVAMTGMYLAGGGLKIDSSEADWKELYSIIEKKFGKPSAELALVNAQIEWYTRHHNVSSAVKYSLKKFKKFPPDLNNWQNATTINGAAFDAFMISNDAKLLNGYVSLMTKLVNHPSGQFYEAMDTYANLLYKTGRKQKAIKWQEKAVQKAPGDEQLTEALKDMKAGKPTYLNQGAVWPNKKY